MCSQEIAQFSNALKNQNIQLLIQTFIPHAQYYKIYFIENKYFAILKQVHIPNGPFDSQISRPECATQVILEPPLHDMVTALGSLIQMEFGLSLFGIDLIVIGTKCYFVDLNFFPSYKSIEAGGKNGTNLLTDFILHKLYS